MKPNPIDRTEEAIQKLVAFSQEEEEDRSLLPKTIRRWMQLLLPISAKKEEKLKEVQRAAEWFNRNRLNIMSELSKNPDDQRRIEASIKEYNETLKRIQHSLKNNPFLNYKAKTNSSLLSKLPQVVLPQNLSRFHYSYPTQTQAHVNHKIAFLQQALIPAKLPQQLKELFQMKALSRLEELKIATNPEARKAIKEHQIHIHTEADKGNLCTLFQTISLVPGQNITIKGKAEIDPKTGMVCSLKLDPREDSIQVDVESLHMGYPYPSQRAGWSLANQLIPEYPQRVDLLPQLQSLFEKKKQAALDLRAKEPLTDKAKLLIKMKRVQFEIQKEQFLDLHRELALALYQASRKTNSDFPEVVDRFFKELGQRSDAYDVLSEVHQNIGEYFITLPHDNLLKALMVNRDENLNKFLKQDCQKAIEVLAKKGQTSSAFDQLKFEYMIGMGSILGPAAQTIMLQYLSEDLGFEPPVLNAFEKKLQRAAYLHVENFLEELSLTINSENADHQEEMQNRLLKYIKDDISLFLSPETEDELSETLSSYFKDRYNHQF